MYKNNPQVCHFTRNMWNDKLTLKQHKNLHVTKDKIDKGDM